MLAMALAETALHHVRHEIDIRFKAEESSRDFTRGRSRRASWRGFRFWTRVSSGRGVPDVISAPRRVCAPQPLEISLCPLCCLHWKLCCELRGELVTVDGGCSGGWWCQCP